MKKAALLFSVSFSLSILSACSESTIDITKAPTEQICVLRENLAMVSRPFYFDIADNGQFVLTDFTNVFLYSADGEQLRQIGNAGRAQFEYLNPGCVKIHKDTIYVWSASSSKFITYSLDGTPISEYQYRSGVTDFAPSDEQIYIYTAGIRDSCVIDVVNKHTCEVTQSLTVATPEHKILLNMVSCAPIYLDNQTLYYCSKDSPDIQTYQEGTRENALSAEIDTETFTVENIPDYDSMARDRKRWMAFIDENPQTLAIFRQEGQLFLLTLEGTATMKGDIYDPSGRYFGLYSINDGKQVARYSSDSIGTSLLFSSNADGLYFIKISDDEQNPYSLHKLIL